MKVVSIASGSKGNSTLIISDNVRILVDAGLTCKELETRLTSINVDPSTITAILITHEHSDHIKGVAVFARKFGTKIYVPVGGFDYLERKVSKLPIEQVVCFASNEFFIGDLSISVFELPHDSNFCCGYSFTKNGKKISIATDLGHTNFKILQNLQGSDILYLEANHDEAQLLANPHYTDSLKNRILSPKGHLSNLACAKAIAFLADSGIKQVVLSHLSEENNAPILAYNTIKDYLLTQHIVEGKNLFIDVASQENVGTVFEINEDIM